MQSLQEREQELLKVKNVESRFKSYVGSLKNIVENGIEAVTISLFSIMKR